jgi:hypothetical protein
VDWACAKVSANGGVADAELRDALHAKLAAEGAGLGFERLRFGFRDAVHAGLAAEGQAAAAVLVLSVRCCHMRAPSWGQVGLGHILLLVSSCGSMHATKLPQMRPPPGENMESSP